MIVLTHLKPIGLYGPRPVNSRARSIFRSSTHNEAKVASPFDRLPPTILERIFVHSQLTWQRDPSRHTAFHDSASPIAAVCHRWRNVMRSCPDMWSCLVFDRSEDARPRGVVWLIDVFSTKLRLYIGLSLTTPLEFTIREPFRGIGALGDRLQLWDLFLEYLEICEDRLKYLDIQFDSREEAQYVLPFKFPLRSLLALLVGWSESETKSQTTIEVVAAQNQSHLKTLVLRNGALAISHVVPTELSRLVLEEVRTFDSVSATLYRAHSLRSLKLSLRDHSPDLRDFTPTLYFPLLANLDLEIQSLSSSGTQLFPNIVYIEAPQLQSLILRRSFRLNHWFPRMRELKLIGDDGATILGRTEDAAKQLAEDLKRHINLESIILESFHDTSLVLRALSHLSYDMDKQREMNTGDFPSLLRLSACDEVGIETGLRLEELLSGFLFTFGSN